MTGPVIELESYRIKEINYDLIIDDREIKYNQETGIKCSLTDEFDFGQVELSNEFSDEMNKRNIKVTLLGQFRINPELKDEEKIKYYLAANGTAILYPYLRAAVSIISSLDSESAVLLPTINVNELLKENFGNTSD